MKVSPLTGALPQGRRFSLQSAAVLLTVVLSALSSTARAQTAKIPPTKNSHLRQVGRHYNNLHYEAAVQLLPQAESRAGNNAKERLWLDLMSGVLHYSVKDSAASEAAFKRAFERAPDAVLPIKNPSQTLAQRFEELRAAYVQEVKAKQSLPSATSPPAPPKPISTMRLLAQLRELERHAKNWAQGPMPRPLAAALRNIYDQASQAKSADERLALSETIKNWIALLSSGDVKGVNELTAKTAPPSDNGSASDKSSQGSVPTTGLDLLRRAISPEVLHERVRRMREWLVLKSEKESTSHALTSLNRLNELFASLSASETAHERMKIAIDLDVLEVQMSVHLGWSIQGSAPKAIVLEVD